MSARSAIAPFGATLALALCVAATPALATTEQATIVSPSSGSLTSSPQESPPHHRPFGGDWAIDLAGAVGRPVHARFSNVSGNLELSVLGAPFEPCASPNQGKGGAGIKVQVTVDGVVLGVVNYLHLAGAHGAGAISNGDQIGTMSSGSSSSCWDGAHVHMEPRNTTQYACFQATGIGSSLGDGSKLGVIGGEYSGGPNQLCPAGAVDGVQPPARPSCVDIDDNVALDTAKRIRLRCTGEGISYSQPSTPAHGTISAFDAGAGTLTYTPATGYSGPDSFTFGASNAGGDSERATARITVLPAKPACAPVTAAVPAATATAVQLSCSGTAFSYAAPSAPAHGTISGFDAATGALTYTPSLGYVGPDSFTYGASNAGGQSEAATVSITVLPPRPVCAPITAVVATGAPSTVQLSCTGQGLHYSPPSAPAHGSISRFDAAAGTLTYTPVAGYSGPDGFTYAAANAGGQSDAALAQLTVAVPPRITNLRARSACVRSLRMRSTPTAGKSGLAFTYTLNQRATVQYAVYRRDGSPARRTCPRRTGGHTQDTFTPVDVLEGNGGQGNNSVVIARSSARRAAAPRPSRLRQRVAAGRQRVRLAQITGRRMLAPGTYVLLVTATNARGQRAAPKHVKFFVLART